MILFQFLVIYLHLLLALHASRRGAVGSASGGHARGPQDVEEGERHSTRVTKERAQEVSWSRGKQLGLLGEIHNPKVTLGTLGRPCKRTLEVPTQPILILPIVKKRKREELRALTWRAWSKEDNVDNQAACLCTITQCFEHFACRSPW